MMLLWLTTGKIMAGVGSIPRETKAKNSLNTGKKVELIPGKVKKPPL